MIVFAVSTNVNKSQLEQCFPGILQGGETTFLGNFRATNMEMALMFACDNYNPILATKSDTPFTILTFDNTKAIPVHPENKNLEEWKHPGAGAQMALGKITTEQTSDGV